MLEMLEGEMQMDFEPENMFCDLGGTFAEDDPTCRQFIFGWEILSFWWSYF